MKITIIMAITLDGKTAVDHEDNAAWTSRSDKKRFAALTKEIGTVIMGRKTYESIGLPLKERLNIVLTGSPEKYKSIVGEVEFLSGGIEEIIRKLEQRGITEAAVIGGSEINSRFLDLEFVDEVILTIEPYLFGKGIGLCDGITKKVTLELKDDVEISEDSVFLRYKVIK